MKYWAFLSYSHTDKSWGDWLHKALETYRIPRRFVGKESRDGKVPERLFPIFRDREELPVSADLGANITEALKESRYLIVICSPRSAQSRWVGEEIKAFKKLGREDRILALIIDGEPNASDAKPGFKIEDECFHEAMRYRFVDGEPTGIRSEPIAADAREVGDGKANAKLKLLAGLLNINYDDLKQREQERRLKRARIVVAAAIALIGVFAVLSAALFLKEREAARARDDAARSRDEARARLSNNYLDRGLALFKSGDRTQGAANLIAALRADPANAFAADRLLFELNYGDWLLATAAVSIPQELREFSKRFEETPVLKVRILKDSDLEAMTLDFDGEPSRTFKVNLEDGNWKLVADHRKPLSDARKYFMASQCEDYEVRLRPPNPDLEKLKGILKSEFNDWPPSLCFSNDRKWAALIDYNSDAYPDDTSPMRLLDWSNGKKVRVTRQELVSTNLTIGEKSVEHELSGLPAFDTKRLLVWVFRGAGERGPEIEAIDLKTGSSAFSESLDPLQGLRGLRPRLAPNGNSLVVRYKINNRPGEVINVFSVEREIVNMFSDGSDRSRFFLRPIGTDLRLPGALGAIAADGNSFVALLHADLVAYKLSKHPTLEDSSIAKTLDFHNGINEDGMIQTLSKDGKLKAVADAGGHFAIVDVNSGTTVASFESRTFEGVDASGRSVQDAKFSSDSRWLFVWGGSDNYGTDTEIYDPFSGRLIYQQLGPQRGQDGFGAVEAELPDGKSVVLQNGKILRLRLAGGPMPDGFADLAEGIVGAYIDERGVYHVEGASESRPIVTTKEIQRRLSELDPKSEWTGFAKNRFASEIGSR